MAEQGATGTPPVRRRTEWTIAYLLAGALGLVTLLALLTAPVADILGPSRYAIPSALHGVSAIVYVIVSTVLVYLAYLLFTGRLEAYRDLRILAALNAFFSALTILFGNWIYIYYRASEGPRAHFLETSPALHQIFFEFKEFIALFTLPLAVAGAYVVWRERESLEERVHLREATAVVLVLSWLCLMLAFGLGAAITKVRAI